MKTSPEAIARLQEARKGAKRLVELLCMRRKPNYTELEPLAEHVSYIIGWTSQDPDEYKLSAETAARREAWAKEHGEADNDCDSLD